MGSTPTARTPQDVLDYIDWVWSLQWREAHRRDPTVSWQEDLSWDQITAMIGTPGILASLVQWPGDLAGDELLNAQLYWPGQPPSPAPAPSQP